MEFTPTWGGLIIQCERYINYVDLLYQQVDVTDDYLTEKKQIQHAHGRHFNFSYGDYIVKLLAGSIDPVLDGLDERRLPSHVTGGYFSSWVQRMVPDSLIERTYQSFSDSALT